MKFLKVAAIVVGVVALAATGVGLAMGGALAGAGTGALGATAAFGATLMQVGMIASVVGGVLSLGTALFAPKPSFTGGGNPLTFTTNPQSGLPYALGRTRMSGLRVHADTYDGLAYKSEGKDDILSFVALLSAGGEIEEIESFRADKQVVTFNPSTGMAIGGFADWMAQKVSRGVAGAAALQLAFGGAFTPDWGPNHQLSGMAHAVWSLRFDAKGEKFGAGVPEPEWVGKWNKVYDPRQDSTYPGGSGPCRPLDESTYVWAGTDPARPAGKNPFLQGLTWALGRVQNGKRTLGIGAPFETIRVTDFVEGANVADANGWTSGGVEWSTDAPWSTLKRMLQAGGGEPTTAGGMIGCRVNAPRVSIATVTGDDLLDGGSFPSTRSRRDRFNTVIPRFRSEDHDWAVISGSPITVPDFVTQDRGQRTKEIDFPLVQSETGGNGLQQAGQLAAYEIVNSREAGPWQFTVGPKFIGVKLGDVITLDVPSETISAQPVIVRSRSIDPATGKITFQVETETTAKHDFALGKTTTPPPSYPPTPPDLTPPTPSAARWALAAGLVESAPSSVVGGACGFPGADAVLIEYRKVGETDWQTMPKSEASAPVNLVISPLDGETDYEARLAYQSGNRIGDWLELDAVTTPAAPENDQFDAQLLPAQFGVAVDSTNAVPSYAGAEGDFVIRLRDGTDVSSSFTLSTVSNPQALTVTYTAQHFAISAGLDVAEPLARLGILATGTGAYAGIQFRREFLLTKNVAPLTISYIAGANDTNGNKPDTPTISSGPILSAFFNTGNASVGINYAFGFNAAPDHKNNVTLVKVRKYRRTTGGSYTWGSDAANETEQILFANLTSGTLALNVNADEPADFFYWWQFYVGRAVQPGVDTSGFKWSDPVSTSTGYRPADAGAYQPPLRRIATAIPAITWATDGSAVDHNVRDVVADIVWRINYPGSTNLISGIEYGTYASIVGTAYTPGTTPTAEFRQTMSPTSPSFGLRGVIPRLYYTGMARAYRNVDTDIDPTGRIYGPWSKPTLSGENPYQPETQTEIASSVLVGGVATAGNVATWSGYASLALNSDGTIKPNMVSTSAIQNQALVAAGYTVQGGTIVTVDGEVWNSPLGGASVTLRGARAVLDVQFNLALIFDNPNEGDLFASQIRGWIQASGGSKIYASGVYREEYRWQEPNKTGSYVSPRRTVSLQFVFSGHTTGLNYDYGFEIDNSLSGMTNGLTLYPSRAGKLNDLRATE